MPWQGRRLPGIEQGANRHILGSDTAFCGNANRCRSPLLETEVEKGEVMTEHLVGPPLTEEEIVVVSIVVLVVVALFGATAVLVTRRAYKALHR